MAAQKAHATASPVLRLNGYPRYPQSANGRTKSNCTFIKFRTIHWCIVLCGGL